MNNAPICQSCGMPMMQKMQFGLNKDESKSEYCVHCFKNGEFTDKKLTAMSVRTGMDEKDARAWAEGSLPKLKRWKK